MFDFSHGWCFTMEFFQFAIWEANWRFYVAELVIMIFVFVQSWIIWSELSARWILKFLKWLTYKNGNIWNRNTAIEISNWKLGFVILVQLQIQTTFNLLRMGSILSTMKDAGPIGPWILLPFFIPILLISFQVEPRFQRAHYKLNTDNV